jgi:tetratricopeptide (TPR) repeat protein
MKERGRFLFFFLIFTIALEAGYAQVSGLQEGIRLYGEGRWREAVVELRRVQAAEPGRRAEALYWIFLSELAAGEYAAAIRDIEELERIDPQNPRNAEISYHKGRVLYYMGRYDEAAVLLKAYADGIDEISPEDETRKAAALYWIGECLFSLGQLDRAFEIFSLVADRYPQSVKFEAASYRIALINQKKVESELLTILKWSHEESLKTVEEYQRRERSYDQAIIAYQKRIAEMLKDSRPPDIPRVFEEAPAAIVPESPPDPPAAEIPPPESDKMIRLLSDKTAALELINEIERTLNAINSRGEKK